MKRIALSLLLLSAPAYAAPTKAPAPRKPMIKSAPKTVAPKPVVTPSVAPAAPVVASPVPVVEATPAPVVASPAPVVEATPAPVVASPTPAAPVAATPSLEVVPAAASPSLELKPLAATPSLEVVPVAATVSVPVVEVKATPSVEVKALTVTPATASLAITNAKVEKTGGSFPLDFSKMPSLPRLGLKIGYDWGNGTEAHRYNYAISGNPEVTLANKDMAGKQGRIEWSMMGLGVGAAIAGYAPKQDDALWPGQTQDLYFTLPGLRIGYRTESFSGNLTPDQSIGTWFGGLYSDGPLLVDLLRFGYDVNLGAGQWNSNKSWHMTGNGEAFLGIKLDWIGFDIGYRYGLTSGNAPTDLNPMTLASGLLGIGEKPSINTGTNQGMFLRTKLYW